MKKQSFALILLLLLVPGPALKAVDFEFSLVSRYIWRGFDLLPQNKPAFQPSLTFALGESGFSINLWSSFSLAERRLYRELDEIDLTLQYEKEFSRDLALTFGLVHYGYYFARPFSLRYNTTQELFLTLGLNGLPLAPQLSIFYDFNLGDGFYGQLEMVQNSALRPGLALQYGARLGYNGGQYGISPGFSDITLITGLEIKGKSWTLVPFVHLALILNSEINPDKVELYGGLTVSF